MVVTARALSSELAHDSKLIGQISQIPAICTKLHLGAVNSIIEAFMSDFQGDFV